MFFFQVWDLSLCVQRGGRMPQEIRELKASVLGLLIVINTNQKVAAKLRPGELHSQLSFSVYAPRMGQNFGGIRIATGFFLIKKKYPKTKPKQQRTVMTIREGRTYPPSLLKGEVYLIISSFLPPPIHIAPVSPPAPAAATSLFLERI